jgi:hypothetical protein
LATESLTTSGAVWLFCWNAAIACAQVIAMPTPNVIVTTMVAAGIYLTFVGRSSPASVVKIL